MTQYYVCPMCNDVVKPSMSDADAGVGMVCGCTMKFTRRNTKMEIVGVLDARVQCFLRAGVTASSEENRMALEAYATAMKPINPAWGQDLPEFLQFIAKKLESVESDPCAAVLRSHALNLKKAMIQASGRQPIISVCMTCKIEFDAQPGNPSQTLNLNHGYCPPCAVKAEKEFGLAPKEGA
jgi:hypothetical protein